LQDLDRTVHDGTPHKAAAKISLIITLFNAATNVVDLVDMVLAQVRPDHPNEPDWFDAIFIDDCSSDATVAILELVLAARGNPSHIRVQKNSQNLGLAETLNRTLRVCETEYVLTLQYDCRFGSTTFIAEMLSLMERYPDAAAITGQPASRTQIPFEEKVNLIENIQDIFPPQELRHVQDPEELIYTGFAEGRCDAFRLKAIRDAGYYDTSLRVSGEDQVLSGRFRELGYNVYQAPKLVYFLSLSSEQSSIRRLLVKQHLYGKTHPYILLRARETFSGVFGKRAGRNRRMRVILRASQVLSTGGYLAAAALLAMAWTAAALAILGGLVVVKALLFQKYLRHIKMTGSEFALFAALQPAFDVCYTIGLARGFLHLLQKNESI